MMTRATCFDVSQPLLGVPGRSRSPLRISHQWSSATSMWITPPMQLVAGPKAIRLLLTGNLFGDVLSD